jgi:hypothetical protein
VPSLTGGWPSSRTMRHGWPTSRCAGGHRPLEAWHTECPCMPVAAAATPAHVRDPGVLVVCWP